METQDRKLSVNNADLIAKLVILILKSNYTEEDSQRIQTFLQQGDVQETFICTALAHGVAPLVYYNLKKINGIPKDLLTQLEHIYKINDTRNRIFSDELKYILKQLSKHSIKIAELKGITLARTIFGSSALRTIGDIDLLVSPTDSGEVSSILEEKMGYKLCIDGRSNKSPLQKYNGQISCTKMHQGVRICIELNSHLLPRKWLRLGANIDTDSFLARSVPVKFDNNHILQLSPEDYLLYLCLHAATHFYVEIGLKLYIDIDRFIRHQKRNFDWELFVERVKECKVKIPIYFALLITQQLFKTPIPLKVFCDLELSKSRKLIICKLLNNLHVIQSKPPPFIGKKKYLIAFFFIDKSKIAEAVLQVMRRA